MDHRLGHYNVQNIIKNARHIEQTVNQLGFFRPSYSLQMSLHPTLPGPVRLPIENVESGKVVPSMFNVKYYLNENTYCDLVFEMEDRQGESVFTSFIPSVYSDLGKGTGTFLFYLQILLAHRAGARYIVLDNDTDNTERAAKGIYKWFRPNNRNLNEYNMERFQEAKSVYDQLSVTGGKMVLDLQSFSSDTWKEHVKAISIGKNTNENRPWANGDFLSRVDELLSRPVPASYGPRRGSNLTRSAKKKTPYSRGGSHKKTPMKRRRQTRRYLKK